MSCMCIFVFQTNSHWFGCFFLQTRHYSGSISQSVVGIQQHYTYHHLWQPSFTQWHPMLHASWNQEKRTAWFTQWGCGQQVRSQRQAVYERPWFCSVSAPVSVSAVYSFTVILQLLQIYLIIHWYRCLSFSTWELNHSANSLELSLLSHLCKQGTLRVRQYETCPHCGAVWMREHAPLCVPFFPTEIRALTLTKTSSSKAIPL